MKFFFIILCLLLSNSVFAQNTKMTGISAGSVQSGFSLSESQMSVSQDINSFYLALPKSSQCAYPYKIKYDASFIMTDKERSQSPVKDLPKSCTILKQHEKSNLAQLIYCKDKSGKTAELSLGEGMPIILGKFRATDDIEGLRSDYESLRKIYWTGKAPESVGKSDSSLAPINLGDAKKILSSGTNIQKKEMLEKLGSNLWTATPETIVKRMALFEAAAKDKSPEIKISALELFSISGRIPQGLPLIKEMLQDFSNLNSEVQKSLTQAIVYLLSESHQKVAEKLALINRFSTDDPSKILQLSNNIVDAKDRVAFENLCYDFTLLSASMWTKENVNELREMLKQIQKENNVEAIRIASQGLLSYKSLDQTPHRSTPSKSEVKTSR